MPLQASTTDQLPEGMTNCSPSRYTGTPLARTAATVKSAVHCISWGVNESPSDTAKNENARGNKISVVNCRPNTSGTASTTIAVKANCAAELATTKSPTSHSSAAAAIGSSIKGQGRGAVCSSAARRRQTSHNTMGGTSTAWA